MTRDYRRFVVAQLRPVAMVEDAPTAIVDLVLERAFYRINLVRTH
jgi:hypothetical protein